MARTNAFARPAGGGEDEGRARREGGDNESRADQGRSQEETAPCQEAMKEAEGGERRGVFLATKDEEGKISEGADDGHLKRLGYRDP